MPAASAMSRTVVFLNPFSAKSPAAIRSSSSLRDPSRWSRPSGPVDSGMLAAHGDDLTGQVRRVLARQEDHHVGDLPRLRCAAERLALLELVEQLVGGDLGEEGVHGE